MLKPEDRATLEESLAGVERDTTAEIAVVTVPTLCGKPVEAWKADYRTVPLVSRHGAPLNTRATDHRQRVRHRRAQRQSCSAEILQRILQLSLVFRIDITPAGGLSDAGEFVGAIVTDLEAHRVDADLHPLLR